MEEATTVKLHIKTMWIMWIIGVDILTILGTFSFSKAAIIIHSAGGFLISIFSMFISLPILIRGFDHLDPVNDSKYFYHVFFGTLLMCALIAQIILGMATRLINIFGGKSEIILNLKHLHMIFGIIITIGMKIQVYCQQKSGQRTISLIIDAVWLLIYTYIKFGSSALTYSSINVKQNQIPIVSSLKEIANDKNEKSALVIYGNYVYDLSGMKEWHPAGFQIIESVKNTQIEKYLFGIYSSSKMTNIKFYAHSSNSLNLLDAPIAKLSIPSTFKNLQRQNKATILENRLLNQQQKVYELHLKINNQLEFQGYTNIKQIGRFYCLTINNKVTRLYTNVNFLNWKNVIMLKPYLRQSSALQKYYLDRQSHSETVPILIKHYQNGKFTRQLAAGGSLQLMISEEQGLGLQLDRIQSGQIVILAGGTGIYPFLDLFDLIYKRHLIEKNPKLKETLLSSNPLVVSEILTKFKFIVYASFNTIEEIHPIVLQQWRELSNYSRFSVFLNVNTFDKKNYPQLNYTKQRFETIVRQIINQKPVSKFFVCGPSKMKEGLYSILSQQLKPQKFTIL